MHVEGRTCLRAEYFTYIHTELILQPFRHFTYVTAHSPILSSLYLLHSSFYNPSVASPTSQLILQPFFRFSYVTGFHSRHLASRPCSQGTRITKNIINYMTRAFNWTLWSRFLHPKCIKDFFLQSPNTIIHQRYNEVFKPTTTVNDDQHKYKH